MKRSSEVTVWKNKTSSQIIEEIANKYNLVFVGEPTTKVWESMPQSNRSDFEFAQYLSTIETGGQYIFYITDDELHFEKQDYGKKSKWLYTYGKDIIRFKPKLKESNNKGAANKVTLKTVDPSKKASVETSADFNTDTGAKLGGFSTFDVSGNKTGGDLIKRVGGSLDNQKGIKNIPPPSGGKSIPVPSKSDSFNMASSLNKKKSMILTATLEVEGNPLLMAGDIITVENVAKRHEGNWYVNKATHVIKGKSSYLTTLEMVKNGVSKPASSSPAKSNNVNNSIGPKDGNVKKVLPVVRYDANGNRLKN
jgi:phage protein D